MTVLEKILEHPLLERIGWTLVHSIWQSVAVAVMLLGLLWLLRRSGASIRYWVSCGALALIVILPVLTFAAVNSPAVELRVDKPIEVPLSLPPTTVQTFALPGIKGLSNEWHSFINDKEAKGIIFE